MVYEPYEFALFLRKYVPGFNWLGAPKKLDSGYSMKDMREGKFTIVKTKDEIVAEHSAIMELTYRRIGIAIMALIVGLYAFYQVLVSGSDVFLIAAMVAVAWAMYKWWHAGAAYSNYQEFEMRPLLVPVEDIREPSIIPHWQTGKPPSFKVDANAKH